ncbi:pro-FMRFamide-related neuropeptide VF [Genypterus blacodes]|uniref:pro-FMRFamide-related neuropeptide VF n=1 Tax=Genypterus blacodes TaxID=154954 RepID=UPI003F75EB34
MMPTVFLLLALLGGFGGTAVSASDLQVHGKTLHSQKSLLHSDDTMREQLHEQKKSKIRRILDTESFNIYVMPTAGRISLPTIIKLHPPTIKPLHKHPNMPMRFGRQMEGGGDRLPSSTVNLPQRFGRSRTVVPKCTGCQNAPPQMSQRNGLLWSLLRNLVTTQSLNRSDNFDLTGSAEEDYEDLQGKTSAEMKMAELAGFDLLRSAVASFL